MALYTLAQTDDAEGEEEVDMQGMITDVGIGTDFRYDAASAEPHDTLDLSMTKVHDIRSYPTRRLQSTPQWTKATPLMNVLLRLSTQTTPILMQRPAPSLAPTRIQMRLVGLHGYADRRVIDTTQTLTSQMAEGWSHIRRAPQPVVDLHTVEYPPTFNAEAPQPMTIVQFQDDHFEQINDDDVLAVVTIILQEPQRREKLRVHWIPHKLTRQGFRLLSQGCRDSVTALRYFAPYITTAKYGQKKQASNGICSMEIICVYRSARPATFGLTLNLRKVWKGDASSSARLLVMKSTESQIGNPTGPTDHDLSGHRSERSRSRSRHNAYGEESGVCVSLTDWIEFPVADYQV